MERLLNRVAMYPSNVWAGTIPVHWLLLTEARRRDLDVGLLPDLFESCANLVCLGFLALLPEAGGQPKQRPSIVGPAANIFAVDGLGLGCLSIVQQECAECVSNRDHPIGRLAVAQFVFFRDRRSQSLDRGVHLSLAGQNLALQHIVSDSKEVSGLVVAEGGILRRLLGRIS